MDRFLRTGLAALLFTTTSAMGQPATTDDWKIEHLEWQGMLDSDLALELVNPHGDLRVRSGGDDEEIEVLAVLQRHADDPRDAEISVVPAASGDEAAHRIEIVIPTTSEALPEPLPDAWRKRRIDMTVIVPAGTELSLATDRGTIQAKGLSAPVVARSSHGDIQLVSSAGLDARSDYGSLRVELKGSLWSPAPRLSGRTGTIRLRLPHGARFRAELASRGDITTDYSIDIERQGQTAIKHGRVETDPRGPLLTLESERGDLQILEQWPPADTASPAEDPEKD